MLIESVSHSKLLIVHVTPCICGIILLMNSYQEQVCGHFTHSGLTHSVSHETDKAEHMELYPRAYFGSHCQRCLDPANCTKSLWHV